MSHKIFKYLANTAIPLIVLSSCSQIKPRCMLKKDDTIELVVNGDIIKEEIKKENNYDCLLTSSKDYVVNINETELVCDVYNKNKEKNYKNVEIRFDEKWSLKRLKNKKNKNKYIHFYPNELSNQNILWIGNKMNEGKNCRGCRCFPKCSEIYYFSEPISDLRSCNMNCEAKISRYNYFSFFLAACQIIIITIVCYNDPINILLYALGTTITPFFVGCVGSGGWCEDYDKVINCCSCGIFAPIFYLAIGWDIFIWATIWTISVILCCPLICLEFYKCCKELNISDNNRRENIQIANSDNDVIEVTYNGEKIKFPKQELYQRLGINTNNNNSTDINDNLSHRGSVFHNKEIEKFKLENDVRKALKTTLENSGKPNVNVRVLSSDGKSTESINSEFLKSVGALLNKA